MGRALWQFMLMVGRKFQQDRCMQSASSLTTTTLFALVPLITFSIDIYSLFPEFGHFGKVVRGFLLANLLPDVAARLVAVYATQFSTHAAQLTYLGLGMLMGTVFSLILTVDHTFNAIWGTAPRRPLHTRLAIYGGLILLGPLLFGLGLWGMTLLVQTSIGWAGKGAHLTHLVLKWLSFLVMAAGLALAFYKVPDHPVRRRHALFGGVLGALLFEIMKSGFTWFVAHLSSYTLIYGAFAALPIFLAWIHLSWAVILFSAVLTACLPRWKEKSFSRTLKTHKN